MRRFFLGLLLTFLFNIGLLSAQQTIKLEGVWKFSLDEQNVGIKEKWYNGDLSDSIPIPGTTDEAKYGKRTVGSDFGILTRAYKYYGPAWYQKEIMIPSDWKGQRIFLNLERVIWESKVYLGDKEISSKDALGTSHLHDLGQLDPGKHRLTVRVNNRMIHNIGDKGHLYTEYTQSIWNGMVGAIELIAKNKMRLNNPQIYTKIHPRQIQIMDTLINEDHTETNLYLTFQLYDLKTNEKVFSSRRKIKAEGGLVPINIQEKMPPSIKLWDDVHPNMYELVLELNDGSNRIFDSKKIEIGFREITTSRSKILVNGKPVYMRGNLDCVHFPLTGYPSTDVNEWEKIFRIYKSYGLNHVRFHSWCPPEAAFQAANRIGIYMQPEVIWLDWWMAVDNPDREEMNTEGRPKGLGYNPSADAFVKREIHRMFEFYGNHPSFTTMSIGNELGNSDFDIMESWLKPYKENDSRRLYSVSSARKITDMDQFIVTHNISKVGATRGLRGAHTDWDFENAYGQSNIPVIAHEIGQWPVYPRWDEIKKYTGTLKARNLEEFREKARLNNIEVQNEDFVQASGALNQIMYKYEIESFLRTPSSAGIQLLSMQDYQGQGEALVGWLDVFYDSKGITTPEKFRMHHDSTVMLLRLPKYTWKANETFRAKVQVAHYGTSDITDLVYWTIKDTENRLIDHGKFESRNFSIGTSEIIGDITTSLSEITKATKLSIEIGLENRSHKNTWAVWVYPEKTHNKHDVYVAERFDEKVEQVLEKGGKVLLLASELGNKETTDLINFYPLYWSLTFFPGQGKNTIGMVVRDKHPAYLDFPTDSHSDWQWESIYKGARAFYINDYATSYRPLAQPIDDFHRNNKLAAIFELKVGEGKLLVCGFDLKDKNNPVAAQLKYSLLNYMNSNRFQPSYNKEIDSLKKMFTYVKPLKSVVPSNFSNALLYVEAGKLSNVINQNTRWSPKIDLSESKKGTSYTVSCDGVWKDDTSSAWQGEHVDVKLKVPQGAIGSLYVFFHDWNNQGREGDIVFEGREFTIDTHGNDGVWIKIPVMREDTNDGILSFKGSVRKGPNIMISKMVLIEEL